MERRNFFKLAGASAATLAIGSSLSGCSVLPFSSSEESAEEQSVAVGVPIDFVSETDVLIVGSGISGLSAAMDPSEAGYSVIVADKLDVLGGESFTASGLMHVADTHIQKEARVSTSFDDAWSDFEKSLEENGFNEDIDFEKSLFEGGRDWVNRVSETYNAQFADPEEYISKGSSSDFILPKSGLGDMTSVMIPFKDKLATQRVSYMLGLRAVGFILDNNSKAVGMRFYVENTNTINDIKAQKIIIASGGFICNQELVREFLPSQATLACYTTYANGEGYRLCQTVQGQLRGLDKAAPLTADLPQVDTWGQFGPVIDVSPLGKRIAAEDQAGATALVCAKEELGFWWTIFDEQLSENGQSKSVSYIKGKHPKRMVGPFDTLEDLAHALNIQAADLKSTFDAYHAFVKAGKDTDFEKTNFLKDLQTPYYAVKQFPNRFRSFGGIITDDAAQMLDGAGKPVDNIYCCGACATGSYNGLISNAAYGVLAGKAVVSSLAESANNQAAEDESSTPDADSSEPSDPGAGA